MPRACHLRCYIAHSRQQSRLTATQAYLLESSEELFLLCLFYVVVGGTLELEEVGAYTMDFSKKEWVKVTDIGDAAFLLGPGRFAASCTATEHGLKNGRVYVANDDCPGNSNDFHIFDLKEGTREVAGPNQDIPVFPRSPQRTQPAGSGGFVFPAAGVRSRRSAGHLPDHAVRRRRVPAHLPSPGDVQLQMPRDSARIGAHGGHRLFPVLAVEPADRGEDGAARDGRELPEHCQCLITETSSSPPEWVDDGVTPPDSLVLVYDLTKPQLLVCRIRGGVAWVRQPYDMGVYEIPGIGKFPTARAVSEMAILMGIFFYLRPGDEVGALVSFASDPELCPELVNFVAPLPTLGREDEPTVTATKSYLVESSNQLFLVRLLFTGCNLGRVEEVGAYVMDFIKHEWCRVTDIGDAAFLLGHGGFAASCSAVEHGLRGGCVYFACDDLGDSNDFHIFDLKEGTRELVRPIQDIPVLSRKPFWLVPVLP
ncbi:hypothetical protein BAE44_0008715 [Dichanthelium oligosanthes]|uniref:KIB1-4 beta-propeller domain-containing protein n=1 Tax=Dichanthelium oligosanthes TaxID=888268 RepID=A0A1E5VYW4_9POAL|nr:hypothetical protein BAE44_0008715 [Dichanthelium oligosanthes]